MLDHCHTELFTPIMVHPLTVTDEDTSEDCNEGTQWQHLYNDIKKMSNASNAQQLYSDINRVHLMHQTLSHYTVMWRSRMHQMLSNYAVISRLRINWLLGKNQMLSNCKVMQWTRMHQPHQMLRNYPVILWTRMHQPHQMFCNYTVKLWTRMHRKHQMLSNYTVISRSRMLWMLSNYTVISWIAIIHQTHWTLVKKYTVISRTHQMLYMVSKYSVMSGMHRRLSNSSFTVILRIHQNNCRRNGFKNVILCQHWQYAWISWIWSMFTS